MDQGTVQGIGTLLAMLAFIAVCWWAYSGRNKKRFEEAARLPFADDMPGRRLALRRSDARGDRPAVHRVRGSQ